MEVYFFELKKEALVEALEEYRGLKTALFESKENQEAVMEGINNWDSETSRTFREAYSGMLAGKYALLQKKIEKQAELFQESMTEVNRLLNRKDGFAETLEGAMVSESNDEEITFIDYSGEREAGGILKLDGEKEETVISGCSVLEMLVRENLDNMSELEELLGSLEPESFYVSNELANLRKSLEKQLLIREFENSFKQYCQGVRLLDSYMEISLRKLQAEYGVSSEEVYAAQGELKEQDYEQLLKLELAVMEYKKTKKGYEEIKEAIGKLKGKGIVLDERLEQLEKSLEGKDEEIELITREQAKAIDLHISDDGLEELNRLMRDYEITEPDSIALFLATGLHESGQGKKLQEDDGGNPDYYKDKKYTRETRGAGYIQITGDTQKEFLEYIYESKGNNEDITLLLNTEGADWSTYIAEQYPWESAVWVWASHKHGSNVVLNKYVDRYGKEENIFLITQYFVNGYLDKDDFPEFDRDMGYIRRGGDYFIEDDKVYVQGRNYRLPKGYEDRVKCYNDVLKKF